MSILSVSKSELIIGGQRSGKSRRAESLAQHWLGQRPDHTATLIATAQAWDEEMKARIDQHQLDRRNRVPAMTTLEEPIELPTAIRNSNDPKRLLVVDCMTLWLTNLTMNTGATRPPQLEIADLLQAIDQSPNPIVLVGNEIGMGVIPLGSEVRAFVDALGNLNQQLAGICKRVTLMTAGLPLSLKEPK